MHANRTVIAYAAGIATAFIAIAAGSALADMQNTNFDQITVHRINLVEPDGTLRMTIADKAEFPGIIVKGKEFPHASRNDVAGMIFFNDEGTENGGLIFSGFSKDGHSESSGHLSFDQYEQDQVVTLEQGEADGKRNAGLTIDDRPDAPIDFAAISRIESMAAGPDKTAAIQKLIASGQAGHKRLFIGKDTDKDSLVNLRDGQGRTRLVLDVTANGDASIRFLDAQGKVVRVIGPAK
ncbi:MAG: hypothetical protein WBQ17_05170 [Rhizomicrobium sp.]